MACRDCAVGALHEGTPVGRVQNIYGFPTYVSEPPSGEAPKGIILFIPDAFGWEFNNNRILADSFAKKTQSLVYLPEFMNGHVLSTSMFDTMDTLMGNGWMVGKMWASLNMLPIVEPNIVPLIRAVAGFVPFMFWNRLGVARPRVYKFAHNLREDENFSSLPIGAAGYCWGGKYVFLLCSDTEKVSNGKSLIDCGFTAHPSNLSIPADAEPVTIPLSVSVGDIDIALPIAAVQQTKKILEGKVQDKHEVVIIPGAKHGFAIKAHPGDEKAVEQGKQAEEQAISWFTKWFRKASESVGQS